MRFYERLRYLQRLQDDPNVTVSELARDLRLSLKAIDGMLTHLVHGRPSFAVKQAAEIVGYDQEHGDEYGWTGERRVCTACGGSGLTAWKKKVPDA